MVLNEQSRARIDLAAARAFVTRLRHVLGVDDRDFNVCFVDNRRIAKLNRAFRRKPHPTDVLSFPWNSHGLSSSTANAELRRGVPTARGASAADFDGFLGDVVISVETAERNAKAEGHTLGRELSWLMLHGLLHLLGMDHETDHGEMVAMEYVLRARLRLDGATGDHVNIRTTPKRRSFPSSGPSRSQSRTSRGA